MLSVGDAWACTNPTLGRGITLGLLHAVLLRDVLRGEIGAAGRGAFRERTARSWSQFYRACVTGDRGGWPRWRPTARGASRPRPHDGARRVLRAALFAAIARDADAFRGGLEFIGCLAQARRGAGPARHGRARSWPWPDAAPPPALARDAVLRLVA